MGFANTILKRAASMSLGELDAWMDTRLYGEPTYTGKHVNADSAMRVTAVWACWQLLGNSMARNPLAPYRLLGDGISKELARDHYLFRTLYLRPNPFMSAFRWKRLMQVWELAYGNAYSELEVNGRGQVMALWPWHPDRVEAWKDADGALEYRYRPKGRENEEPIRRPWYMMLHIRGLELDGHMGINPIQAHAQSIGYSMAVTEHGARFFGNGARPLGVLEHPGTLGTEGLGRMRADWQQIHGGLANAHRVAILEEGMKYHEVGLKMVDAQYLEIMQFGIGDIARIYGVQPHKIGDLTKSSFSNITEQHLEFDQDSMGPRIANWEDELNFSLLSDREADKVEILFDVNEVMRMDPEKRAKYIATMRQWAGWSVDEARGTEDRNPVPGGDERLTPLNMWPLGKERPAGQPEQAEKQEDQSND